MLTIKAEGSAGMDLRDQMLPEMLLAAKATGCRIQVEANETTFWVHPTDTLATLWEAFDRLYPSSKLVFAGMAAPWPRHPAADAH